MPVLKDTEFWDRRQDVLWYVSLCEDRGFADTDDQKRQCAQRYMAGKRKISAPGTKRRRRAAQEMRKLLANLPPELVTAVDEACQSDMAKQVAGNPKALNALVGMVLKNHRAPPAVVRQLIEMKIGA